MPLKNNFNVDSWRLLPYWVCVFTMPAAIFMTIMSMFGFEINQELFFTSAIISAVVVYCVMRYYPAFAYKAIIVLAVLFTTGVAFSFANAAYTTGGILPAAIVTVVIFALSYFVNRYALKPKPTSAYTPVVFFMF